MGTPTVSQKIDAYAKAHLAELKKKQGLKNFTKYDIAEIMLKSGALTQAEMNSWRSTGEGFSANNRSGSVFGSGYVGQESYLDEMTDFSQKSNFDKTLEVMNPKVKFETKKQRTTRQAQYKQHVQDQQTSARVKNTKAYQNQEAMKKYLATLPPCTESFEELIASQKFESLDKSGKIKFLMEATGRKFYEAMEKGDKSAMRKYALEGMSYVFAYMDDKSGITDVKDAVKKYNVNLKVLTYVVDKIVDDGDADNLSGAEKTWATIKGAGDAVDGFIGTQGVAVMGSLYLAGEAAAAAGMAKLFAVATQAYFGIEGATLVYEGGKEIAEATTEEQARTGGTKLTSGAIMLAGTIKSVKQGYENYKASQAHKADIANARKTLGLEGDAPLTEASIKAAKKSLALANHPDRGGSVEAMQNINDAASLLLKELKGGTLATTTASTADPKADASKAMSELAKTPEGVKQMEDAGLVVSKASIDKLGTIHEGQSQSPARAIKKIDFSGSPEEVCAKNSPLQYDKARGKFYREVSWDGGKTKQPMYIEENDPNGYFMINYGEQPWDGALLGGTEAIKSYVEPEPYNTNGTKVALEPAKMDYNWTTASKAAPVRFAKVPEGIKGVVGKEGFQPITDNNQVVAIDVKGQPYINTAQYVLDNTKGLDASSIKALLEIDPKADASKAMSELAKTPEGVKQMEDAGLVVSKASIDKLGTIHEGQSQSPARAIKKIDFSGSPEEVCAKNSPLQYDKARGKFYREVSWDGGKTKQPMYIEENDPNGYFMINYGEQPWDGALLGGTEAIKSYVEPEPYNTNGTKVALEPAKMDYNWTTASKAAPVRFAKVPEGIKGVVGKEGFQPITDNNQVIAIDVKGQPYINTAQYVLDNTKGLDTDAIRLLDDINNPNKTTTVTETPQWHDREGYRIKRDTESTYKDNEGNIRYTCLRQENIDGWTGTNNVRIDKTAETTTKYNTQTGEPLRSITTKAPESKDMYPTSKLMFTDTRTIYAKSKQFIEYDTKGNITRSTTKFTDSQNNLVGKEVIEFTPNGKKTKKFFTHNYSSRVGSEEIPNADGSTTVKLVAPDGQSFEQVIPKGYEYKITFTEELQGAPYTFKIIYAKSLENSDTWTEKGFSINVHNRYGTIKTTVSTFNDESHSATWVRGYTNHNEPPKTSIEKDFFK